LATKWESTRKYEINSRVQVDKIVPFRKGVTIMDSGLAASSKKTATGSVFVQKLTFVALVAVQKLPLHIEALL
jgi:hypothetical protein